MKWTGGLYPDHSISDSALIKHKHFLLKRYIYIYIIIAKVSSDYYGKVKELFLNYFTINDMARKFTEQWVVNNFTESIVPLFMLALFDLADYLFMLELKIPLLKICIIWPSSRIREYVHQ